MNLRTFFAQLFELLAALCLCAVALGLPMIIAALIVRARFGLP